jgi:hypothetical protein
MSEEPHVPEGEYPPPPDDLPAAHPHGELTTFRVTYADGSTEEIEAHRFTQESPVDGRVETRFYRFPEGRGGEVDTIDRYDVAIVQQM